MACASSPAGTREVEFVVDLHKGRQCFDCRFREVNLRPGHFIQIGLWVATQTTMDWVDDAKVLEIVGSEATGKLSMSQDQGIVVCDYDWSKLEN